MLLMVTRIQPSSIAKRTYNTRQLHSVSFTFCQPWKPYEHACKVGDTKTKIAKNRSLDLGVHNFDPAHTVHLPITTKAVWQPSKTTATLTLLCLKIGKTSKSREWISKHHFATGFADSETEAWPHPCEFSLATAGALWLHLHLFLSPTQRICCLAGGSLNCPLQS